MNAFDFLTAGKIAFGRGRAEDAIAAARTMGHNVLLVRGRSVGWADTLHDALKREGLSVHPFISRGEPDLEQVTACTGMGRAHDIDLVIAIGGGSVIDLGKAAAALIPAQHPAMQYLEIVGEGQPLDASPLPFFAIPTTAGTGAEVTKNAVILVREHARKVSLRDDRMLPDLAIIDPSLTDHSPRHVTLASGLDAITQVIEPYLCRKANPMTDALCRDALPRGLRALARLMEHEEPEARDDLALTSLMGGIALANAGLGAVHGLAGVIGGETGASHGAICGRLLPGVLKANHAAAQTDTARFCDVKSWIAEALGGNAGNAFDTLSSRIDDWGLPRLAQLDVRSESLERIAQEALNSSSMRANPSALSVGNLVQIMQDAMD